MDFRSLSPQSKPQAAPNTLRAALTQIAQNREMVRLDDDLHLPAPLDALQITPRYTELIAALETCEFKGLLAEVKAEAARNQPAPAVVATAQAEPARPAQGELF
jgi:hypothetical protein